ncbi:MAG TPA: serine/threonine-protein kinase [Pseudomonadales bacterium]|jgi:predicted Ser/Thr protein kinase
MDIPGYTIRHLLGQGGMAEVFLAHQQSFDRLVAIKVMDNALIADPHYAERFLREARIVAKLSHPHIVPVFDVGIIDAHHYLAMEHLSGGDLKTRIKEGMNARRALKVLREMAGALDFAHSKGYVHRDIKPDNILFREDGSAVLTDFGIARPRESDMNLTQAGTVVGTPKYMAPEQCQGKVVDGRADLYSLGIVFVEMLTGHAPYDGPDPVAVAIQHLQSPIPQLKGSLAPYQPLVDRLLTKDPEHRFADGAALIKAIDALLRGHTPAAAAPIPESAAPEKPAAAATEGLSLVPKVLAQVRPGLRVQEEHYRQLFSRKERLACDMCCTDAQEFGIQYAKMTTHILDWQSLHGKRCGSIVLAAHIHPDVEPRLREALSGLYQDKGHFTFLKQIPMQVRLWDLQGQPIAEFTVKT